MEKAILLSAILLIAGCVAQDPSRRLDLSKARSDTYDPNNTEFPRPQPEPVCVRLAYPFGRWQ